jgi:ankyrin repeat protein
MEWLASVGVMHDLVDSSGQTCAHVAARRGEIDALRYLSSAHQMDLNQRDNDNESPLDKVPKISLQGNEGELEKTRAYLLSLLERPVDEPDDDLATTATGTTATATGSTSG